MYDRVVSSWKKVPPGSGPSTLMGRESLKPRPVGRLRTGRDSQEILLNIAASFSFETFELGGSSIPWRTAAGQSPLKMNHRGIFPHVSLTERGAAARIVKPLNTRRCRE